MWFLSISHGGFPLKVSIFRPALSLATSSPETHALPGNPAEENITLKCGSSLWLQRRNPFSRFRQPPDPETLEFWFTTGSQLWRLTEGGWSSDWPARVWGLFLDWRRDTPSQPESCSRGEAVCPQKKTGVLLLKAKRSKCKATTLLFAAYIVSWFG